MGFVDILSREELMKLDEKENPTEEEKTLAMMQGIVDGFRAREQKRIENATKTDKKENQ